MSGIVHKIKEAVHSDKHSAPEGSHGPHSTRAANAADPRVDSDRDNSHTVGTGTTGTHTGAGRTAGHGEYGSTNPFSSDTSTTGTHANPLSSHTQGAPEGTYGPHSSRVANAADPRVDSDRDGSRKVGTTGTGAGLGTGMGTGAGGGATGMTGTHGAPAGTYGPHSSRVANAADPRVDSDRDGRGAIGTGGPGPAPNTAGPHRSDMLNKADPRVDSDLDASTTVGGNKTFQQQ